MKGEQIGRKVREIKFPQYIINEKFEKMKINFMLLFWNLVILFNFLVYFFLIKNRKRVFILFDRGINVI